MNLLLFPEPNLCTQAAIPAEADLVQLEVMIGGDTGLRGGVDIFAGPAKPIGGRVGGTLGEEGKGAAGERGTVAGEDEVPEERGTYTMFDEHGDPGENWIYRTLFGWMIR